MTVQVTEASPASETEVLEGAAPAAGGEASSDANPAQSSSADTTDAKQEQPEDLGAIIKKAVEPQAAAEDSSTPEAEEGKVEDGAQADDETDPEADVPFHKHPRWQEMKAERDGLKPDAEAYRSMQNFMHEANLTGEEVAQGFDAMALFKRATPDNPQAMQEARDWLAVRLNAYDQLLGNSLPDDLRQKVEDGFVDEDLAKELARERARASSLEQLRARERGDAEEGRRLAEAQQTTQRVAQSIQSWEANIMAKDPDYAAKAKFVEDRVRSIVSANGRPPASPEEAIEIAQKAYDAVSADLKPMAPRARPINPPPASLSARVSTEPKSFAEAIRSAVNR